MRAPLAHCAPTPGHARQGRTDNVLDMVARRERTGARRWEDVLRPAQRIAAERFAQAGGPDGFGPQAYLDWLMVEAAVAVLCAGAMDDLAAWHGSEPGLRGTAQAWAVELRGMARLAAADLRAIGGVVSPPPPLVEEWRVFLEDASGSQRAGEALGAIALHSRLLPGRAGPALSALLGLPVARAAPHYLARRGHAEADAVRVARDGLLDAYAGAALVAGAQRASTWCLDAIAIAQTKSRG